MPLHQVSSGELDPIRIRATPIRSSTILTTQTKPLTIFKVFSPRWTPSAMLTPYKQFWTLCQFRVHRIGSRIRSQSIARAICWRFSTFFRPDEHRMRRCPCTSTFEHCTTSGPPNRQSNRVRIDRQNEPLMIFDIFSARWTPNTALTTYKQFWTLHDFRSTESAVESGPNRSPERSAGDFQNVFGQMETECIVTISRSTESSNRCRIDDQTSLLTI